MQVKFLETELPIFNNCQTLPHLILKRHNTIQEIYNLKNEWTHRYPLRFDLNRHQNQIISSSRFKDTAVNLTRGRDEATINSSLAHPLLSKHWTLCCRHRARGFKLRDIKRWEGPLKYLAWMLQIYLCNAFAEINNGEERAFLWYSSRTLDAHAV